MNASIDSAIATELGDDAVFAVALVAVGVQYSPFERSHV